MATYTKTWHWNCASSLCTNNYRTKGITYYTLPSDPELQKGYRKVLMNENINWRKHVICSAHWSSGKRENKNQLPDIICTKEYAANLEKEYSQKPSRELKRKIDCTKTVVTSSHANTVRSTPRKPPKDRSETPLLRVKKRRVSAANVEKEDKKLKSQVKKFDKRTKWKKGCHWRFTSTAVKDSIRTWKKGLRTVSNSMQWRKHSKAKLLVMKHSWDTEFTIWQDYHFPN